MATMGATRIISSNHGDLYDARIKQQWLMAYGEPEHEFEKFYRMDSITTQDTRYSYISGFGMYQAKTLGGNISYDGVYQGYDTTITPVEYALAYTVEQTTVEDDPHGLLSGPLATAHATAARDTIEYLAALGPNSPTTSTAFNAWMSGGDAVAMLATTHPVLSGGYWTNCPSSHVDLSIAGLQAAYTRMETLLNPRGFARGMEAKRVVVPPASRFLAREVLEGEKMPYSADNTPNTVNKLIDWEVWSQLTTGNGKWLLFADKAGSLGSKGHMLTCVWRIKPQFDRDNVFDSGDRRYKGRFRIGFGYPDARGIDGSTGAS